MRLPTESEWIRAAFGNPSSDSSTFLFPWGNNQYPKPGKHGNFHFYSWGPTPVAQFPEGKSGFGVFDMIGNGWEWTETIFSGHPGFESYISSYLGYSRDFFDQKHYVMLGASWCTALPLIRRSFRNWYQAHYQFVFAKFRLCSS